MTIVRWNSSPDIAAHQGRTSRMLEGFSSSHPSVVAPGKLVPVQAGARKLPLLRSPRPLDMRMAQGLPARSVPFAEGRYRQKL